MEHSFFKELKEGYEFLTIRISVPLVDVSCLFLLTLKKFFFVILCLMNEIQFKINEKHKLNKCNEFIYRIHYSSTNM